MRLWSVVVQKARMPVARWSSGLGRPGVLEEVSEPPRVEVTVHRRCPLASADPRVELVGRQGAARVKLIFQWSSPQNSEHTPVHVARLGDVDVDLVVDAGDQVALLEELRAPRTSG